MRWRCYLRLIVGFLAGPEAFDSLGSITVSGVLMGMFQNNAGGAWDNAKKSFEKGMRKKMIDGVEFKKGSKPHKAAVTGHTLAIRSRTPRSIHEHPHQVRFSMVTLVIAPHINEGGHDVAPMTRSRRT